MQRLTIKYNLFASCFYCIALLFLFSCNNKSSSTAEKINDTVTTIQPSSAQTINDSAALDLSKQILTIIKQKEYQKLSAFLKDSLRFSPYGYVDTLHDKTFGADYFSNYKNDNAEINWGIYNGSGEPIELSLDKYFEKFVYDVDFITAPQISLNKSVAKTNSLNNIDDVYKDCVYIEFYFPGFDKKYEGMDWRSLKLVFKKDVSKLYLVAIIHDEWTP